MRTRSRRVKVRPGEAALAPRVDDPRGFAIENELGQPLTVSFRYDFATRVQTVVVEPPQPRRTLPGELGRFAGEGLA